MPALPALPALWEQSLQSIVKAGSLQYTSKQSTDLQHSAVRPLYVP